VQGIVSSAIIHADRTSRGRENVDPDHILSDVGGGVASITLNRPDKLNAFTAAMLVDFRTALEHVAHRDAVRAVLITGAGRAFCAGQDLSDRAVSPGSAPPDLGESLEHRYNPIVRLIRSMPKPVVVAVNGVAAGAGANLALAGDLVIAARSARFIQSFARIGLVPDSGGTYFLPRALGVPRAMGLALLGEALPAERAAEWGLIWQVVDDADLAATARAMAQDLAAGPTAGYAKIKQALGVSLEHSLDRQLDLERDLQRAAGQSRDYQEGVAAFMAKREPRFEGR
jgi:2-(1,2-epoxy-1,2-dihydrophenyl)acetyl-CoA isomerase